MVVVNFVNPDEMQKIDQNFLNDLWETCYKAYEDLIGEWFELKNMYCLCYVERSLNKGNVVIASMKGHQPTAFPNTCSTITLIRKFIWERLSSVNFSI